jgi:hypothetical protein
VVNFQGILTGFLGSLCFASVDVPPITYQSLLQRDPVLGRQGYVMGGTCRSTPRRGVERVASQARSHVPAEREPPRHPRDQSCGPSVLPPSVLLLDYSKGVHSVGMVKEKDGGRKERRLGIQSSPIRSQARPDGWPRCGGRVRGHVPTKILVGTRSSLLLPPSLSLCHTLG